MSPKLTEQSLSCLSKRLKTPQSFYQQYYLPGTPFYVSGTVSNRDAGTPVEFSAGENRLYSAALIF